MDILEFNYNDDRRVLYVEFKTGEDGDDYYRSQWLSLDEIQYFSPTIIHEHDMYVLDEEFIVELLNSYYGENDLPEQQNL